MQLFAHILVTTPQHHLLAPAGCYFWFDKMFVTVVISSSVSFLACHTPKNTALSDFTRFTEFSSMMKLITEESTAHRGFLSDELSAQTVTIGKQLW